jgi:hypothetical protein
MLKNLERTWVQNGNAIPAGRGEYAALILTLRTHSAIRAKLNRQHFMETVDATVNANRNPVCCSCR